MSSKRLRGSRGPTTRSSASYVNVESTVVSQGDGNVVHVADKSVTTACEEKEVIRTPPIDEEEEEKALTPEEEEEPTPDEEEPTPEEDEHEPALKEMKRMLDDMPPFDGESVPPGESTPAPCSPGYGGASSSENKWLPLDGSPINYATPGAIVTVQPATNGLCHTIARVFGATHYIPMDDSEDGTCSLAIRPFVIPATGNTYANAEFCLEWERPYVLVTYSDHPYDSQAWLAEYGDNRVKLEWSSILTVHGGGEHAAEDTPVGDATTAPTTPSYIA